MHPITFFTNIIGVVTIVLISIVSILGLICLCHSLNFQLLIKRRRRNYYQANDEQLSYFNGPWLTRITLILVALWWGVGEVLRLTFVNGEGRFISDQTWQANVCKFYIVSNLGFAEPGLFLLLAFLLSAALHNQEVGALNRKWNQRTICAVFMLCSPSLIWEACVVLLVLILLQTMDRHQRLQSIGIQPLQSMMAMLHAHTHCWAAYFLGRSTPC